MTYTSTKWPVNSVWNVSRSVFLTSKNQIKFYDHSDLSHPFTIMTNTFEALGFFTAVFRGQLSGFSAGILRCCPLGTIIPMWCGVVW